MPKWWKRREKKRMKKMETTYAQKANEKATLLSRVVFHGIVEREQFDIEIQKNSKIESGIELFVRAWDKKGDPIGFVDGTVEIERFRIFNPPVLVSDQFGAIRREYVDEETGIATVLTFREDHEEAILQVLEHNIKIVGKGGEKIEKGKVGQTTSTFFPAAGANSPVDGRVRRAGVNETFAVIRGGAGNDVTDTGAFNSVQLEASGTTDQFATLARSIAGFDTSSIPDTDAISSATLSLYNVDAANSVDLGDTDVDIVSSAPASSSGLANGDYSNLGTTRFATGKAVSALSTTAYNDFALNATGIAQISKTGNSFFGWRLKWDVDNSFTGSWVSGAQTQARFSSADVAGTTQDPKLVVVHAAAAADAPVFIPPIFFS